MTCLASISRNIQQYQATVTFDNVLSIRDLLKRAFNGLKGEKGVRLKKYYDLIMQIIVVLEQDGKNTVSSHNDLLPSSNYCIDGESIVVDWEYSARNHPYFDLAHLSVVSSLTLWHKIKPFLPVMTKLNRTFLSGRVIRSFR